MKRTVVVVVGLLLAVGGGAYILRDRLWRLAGRSQPSTGLSAPDTKSGGAADAAMPSPSTLRGPITIDPRRQQLIGVRTVPVARGAADRIIRAVGVVRYDETRQTDVNVKVEGWIRDLYVDYTGQAIQAGQPLFTLYSPELLAAQNEYLLALRTRAQIQQSTIADARQRADDLVAAARQRLTLWDLSPEDLRTLDDTHQPQSAIVFRSPAGGFVVEKQAVKGLHVTPGQSLYKVANLSNIWVEAEVYESELAAVRVGDQATVTVDAYPGETFSGRVTYIYPYLDEKTRTNKVRLAFANRAGRLKPGMFAHVELNARGRAGLTVPTNAVLDSGTEQVVFVAQGDGVFEPRTVKIGRRLGDAIEILEGVKEGEQVATGATFFLDSESQLRASLQGFEATGTVSGTQITFQTVPDPPKVGDNTLEATVKDATGKPIDDAEVAVQFLMPAMPTMNMPAMRSETRLSRMGNGVYRGNGQVMMAGRWDTTVTVTRGGQHLGSKQLPVVAK